MHGGTVHHVDGASEWDTCITEVALYSRTMRPATRGAMGTDATNGCLTAGLTSMLPSTTYF